MSTPLSGGYCGGVPPLPIPNREVKPTCADGTAMQCGRVGSRLLFIRAFIWAIKWTLFLFMSLMGLLQIPQQKVWRSRAWRKSFPERFGISAYVESYFPNGLLFPRMAKVISRIVCYFRAWRKLFPERFVISAHGESRFPNGFAFPRLAKVISRMVWRFCVRRIDLFYF